VDFRRVFSEKDCGVGNQLKPFPLVMSALATILLADDDEDDVFLLDRAFKEAQVPNRRNRVADGEQVLAYLEGAGEYSDREKFPYPHYLLLDLQMPTMDGFEVLKWIRQHPRHKRLPVIAFTGHESKPVVRQAYDLGANSLHKKPSSFDDLLKLVEGLQAYWNVSQVPPTPPLI
jgi:CheY-like chemotaxis protein